MQDLFPFLDNCWSKRDPVLPDHGQTNDYYMAMRFLSMDPRSIFTLAALNEFAGRIPKWAICCCLYHITPGPMRPPRNKLIKKAANGVGKGKKARETVLSKLQGHLNCSPRHAEEVYNALEMHGVNIWAFFGEEKK